jgi:hypothetical protein
VHIFTSTLLQTRDTEKNHNLSEADIRAQRSIKQLGLKTALRYDLIECSLWAACLSQQFHSLIELITIHINISLRCADIKATLSLLHEKFFNSFPMETDFFFAIFE